MGLFAKLMMVTVIVAVITPLWVTGPNGQPLKSIAGLNINSIKTAGEKLLPSNTQSKAPTIAASAHPSDGSTLSNASISQGLLSPSGQGVRSFYKWKDQDGVWQFTTHPPQDPQTNYNVITTDPNANVIQSLSKSEISSALGWASKESATEKKPKEEAKTEPSLPFPSTIPADQIPQLIEQAKSAQELMNNRNKALEAL